MKSLARDVSWQIIGKILSAGAGFVVLLLLTIYLDPLRYGDYGTILAYFAFISSLSDFGLYSWWVKECAQYPPWSHEEQVLYSKIFWARMMLIGCIYVVAILIVYCIPDYRHNIFLARGMPIGMLFSAIFMASGVMTLPLQLRTHMHHASIALMLARLGQIGILVSVIFFLLPRSSTYPLLSFILVMSSILGSAIIQFAYTWRFARKDIAPLWMPSVDFLVTVLKEQRRYGLGFFLWSASTMVVSVFFSLLYPTREGNVEISMWTFALQLYAIVLIIPPAVGNSLLSAKHDMDHDATTRFAKGIMVLVICALTLWWWFILGGRPVMNLIGATSYITDPILWENPLLWRGANIWSDAILIMLGCALVAHFFKIGQQYRLLAINKQESILRINGRSFVIGCIVSYRWIYTRGLWGWIIGQFCFDASACLLWRWKHRSTKIFNQTQIVLITTLIGGTILLMIMWLMHTTSIRRMLCIIRSVCVGIGGWWWRQKHINHQSHEKQ